MVHEPPSLPGVQHRWITTRRVRLHVAEAGSGAPLILIHGWPQHWYAWRRLIPMLAGSHRLICPDLRGLGWSDAPAGGYWKEDLASDLIALLDALDLDRVGIVGHDWGSFVGYLTALRAPDRVSGLLALNQIHPWLSISPRDPFNIWRLWYQAVLSVPGAGPWTLREVASFLPLLFRTWAPSGEWTEEEIEVFAAPLREPERARASGLYYRTFLLAELPALLAGRYRNSRLRVPTLQLFGREDGVIRVHQLRGFERHADEMKLELVPGVGHFIAEEAPELVARRALEHFAAVSA